MPFSGERVWHSCEIDLRGGPKQFVDLWFLPRYRIVYLRNIQFGSSSDGIRPKPVARDGAFTEFGTDGTIRLLTFGSAEHLTIPLPAGYRTQSLRFEYQVTAGKEAALQNAQRLTAAFVGTKARRNRDQAS
jgi:hypothetical protein